MKAVWFSAYDMHTHAHHSTSQPSTTTVYSRKHVVEAIIIFLVGYDIPTLTSICSILLDGMDQEFESSLMMPLLRYYRKNIDQVSSLFLYIAVRKFSESW